MVTKDIMKKIFLMLTRGDNFWKVTSIAEYNQVEIIECVLAMVRQLNEAGLSCPES